MGQPFARWFERDFDFVSLNRTAIVEVVVPRHEHVLALDPRFDPKSVKQTHGFDVCWNNAHNRQRCTDPHRAEQRRGADSYRYLFGPECRHRHDAAAPAAQVPGGRWLLQQTERRRGHLRLGDAHGGW
jgi:hypothetical protein